MTAVIGFIGTGVMGKSMVKHLIKKGYAVNVYNRTKNKSEELVEIGAIWRDTPFEITKNSDVIISMVGYPQDVEEVYFGENGIFQAANKHHILIDMTTSTPTLAKKIYNYGHERGIQTLDAPVSGGDRGAREGILTTMVGGDETAFIIIKPILECFSSRVNLLGPAGSGQHTKMANQIMIAGTMIGMTELMVYAQRAGLNLQKVLDTVGAGSAANWSLANYAPRILNQDFAPGFYSKHFLKDLKIALDEAEKMRLNLPGTREAKRLYQNLCDLGYENDGTQALIKLWWKSK